MQDFGRNSREGKQTMNCTQDMMHLLLDVLSNLLIVLRDNATNTILTLLSIIIKFWTIKRKIKE